jgi:hypothetical protein
MCSEHERLSLSCDELALGVHKTPNRKQAYRAPPQVLPSFLVTTLLCSFYLTCTTVYLLVQCSLINCIYTIKRITEPMLSTWILHRRHIHWGNNCLFLLPTTCFTVTVNEIKVTRFVLLI